LEIAGVLKVTNKLRRLAVALGGFLIFLGIIVIAILLFNILGVVDFNITETENLQNLSLMMLFAIGLLDLVAGIILWKK